MPSPLPISLTRFINLSEYIKEEGEYLPIYEVSYKCLYYLKYWSEYIARIFIV